MQRQGSLGFCGKNVRTQSLGQSKSTEGKAIALLMADLASVSGIMLPCAPPRIIL